MATQETKLITTPEDLRQYLEKERKELESRIAFIDWLLATSETEMAKFFEDIKSGSKAY